MKKAYLLFIIPASLLVGGIIGTTIASAVIVQLKTMAWHWYDLIPFNPFRFHDVFAHGLNHTSHIMEADFNYWDFVRKITEWLPGGSWIRYCK